MNPTLFAAWQRARLRGEDRVAFRYEHNPNGSQDDIAGILSENRRVLGMMPHPERCSEGIMGGEDGRAIFESLISNLHQKGRVKKETRKDKALGSL